jgi:hypothetical protein
MPHRPRVAAMVSALLLLAACTDAEPDAEAGASSTSSTSLSSAAPTSASDPTTPTDEQVTDDGSDDGSRSEMRVTGIRLTGQNGSSRLVVDLSGNGVPEWTVGYSEPTDPGGGPVDISGDAFLRVQLRTGTQPSGQSSSRVSASPGPVVEARTTGYFEGTEEVLIGVRGGEVPFRAYAQTDPGRIVIDVGPAS